MKRVDIRILSTDKQNPGKDKPSINQVIHDKLACSNWIEGKYYFYFIFHNNQPFFFSGMKA